MPKFFTANGRTFMEVHPVESLQNSTMVKSVLKRGDKFVVDMNTGKLTVYSHPKVETPKLRILLQFPKSEGRLGEHTAHSVAQAVFWSNDYADRWGEYEQVIIVSYGEQKVTVCRNAESVPSEFERILKLVAADVSGAPV